MSVVSVLIKLDQEYRQLAFKIISDLAEIRFLERGDEREREELIADAEVAIASYIPPKLLEKARRLKFIQTLSAGVDRFDLELLRKRGILLASAKGCNARSVAEHALALILALSKKIPQMDRRLKEGRWRTQMDPWPEELDGKVVGIIGYGNIGRELARMVKALGMKVLAIKRRPMASDRLADFIGGPEDLDRVLSESDFIVIALPLTRETRGLIGERELKLMKPTAYIINVGRGPIIDEAALAKALKEGWIAGAAIDTWWAHPPNPSAPSHLGIHLMPNVIATPHIAGLTKEARRRCIIFAFENVRRYLLKQRPFNLVDYDVGY